MEATFAEILLLVAFGIILYRVLRPLQQLLQKSILKVLRRGSKRADKPIINVTSWRKE